MFVCSFSRFAFLPCKRHPSGCRAGESGIAERLCLSPVILSLEFLSKRNVNERLKQNLEVEPPRAVLQVVKIKLQSA